MTLRWTRNLQAVHNSLSLSKPFPLMIEQQNNSYLILFYYIFTKLLCYKGVGIIYLICNLSKHSKDIDISFIIPSVIRI